MSESLDAHLFVDLGSSMTKIFYSNSCKRPVPLPAPTKTRLVKGKNVKPMADGLKILLIPPAIATVSKNRLAEVLAVNATASPADSAWLKFSVTSEGERLDIDSLDGAVCVGRLAENFKGDCGLTQRKADVGLARTLAAIGVVREVLKLPTTFSCSLGLALPVMEYQHRQQFQAQLQENTAFVFRGQRLNVNYSLIDVQPEGLGLIRDRKRWLEKQGEPAQTIVSLMFGYRNLSILVVEDGNLKLDESRSDGPGFVTAVEITAKSLGLEPEIDGLMEAVAESGKTLRVKGKLHPLDINAAVQEGRAEYWQRVTDYLKSHLPGGHYDLVYGGGTAWAMQTELQDLLESIGLNAIAATASTTIQGLQQSLPTALKMSSTQTNSLSRLTYQLADPYVGFQALLMKAAREAKAKKVVA